MKKLFKALVVAAVAAPSALIYSAYVQNENQLAMTESMLMDDVEALATPGDHLQGDKVLRVISQPFCPNGTYYRYEKKTITGKAESEAAFRALFKLAASVSVTANGNGTYSYTKVTKTNVPVQYTACIEGQGNCKPKTCAEAAIELQNKS